MTYLCGSFAYVVSAIEAIRERNYERISVRIYSGRIEEMYFVELLLRFMNRCWYQCENHRGL